MKANDTLRKIAAERKALSTSFDEGDLTSVEYDAGLSALFEQERGAGREIDRIAFESAIRHVHPPRRLALYLLVAFAIGFFISPLVYPRIFGYRYAEECMLEHSTSIGATACIDLFPRSPDLPTQPPRVDQPERQ